MSHLFSDSPREVHIRYQDLRGIFFCLLLLNVIERDLSCGGKVYEGGSGGWVGGGGKDKAEEFLGSGELLLWNGKAKKSFPSCFSLCKEKKKEKRK